MNDRKMFLLLKNHAAVYCQGPVKIELSKGEGILKYLTFRAGPGPHILVCAQDVNNAVMMTRAQKIFEPSSGFVPYQLGYEAPVLDIIDCIITW